MQFENRQKQRIETHIRFGDYWYTANERLKRSQKLSRPNGALDIGLDMEPEKAWRWIASGGFINEDLNIGVGASALLRSATAGSF